MEGVILMRFFRPQVIENVAEELVKTILKVAFWLSFFGLWKVYEIFDKLITYHR
jgi:hypothetical protein